MFASLTRYASSSCPFQVLGLKGSKRSSVDPINYEQVCVAFRDLAFKHHPDTSQSDDSEKEFIRIKAAFEAIEEDDTGMAVVRGNRPYIKDEHETSTNQNEKKKYSQYDWSNVAD
jgi:DnaJ-class molecular chaperone